MTLSCPRCHTAFFVRRRRAQTTATAIGGVAGAIQGASSAITESKCNSEPMGVIAGAILGGFVGGAAGCATGAAIGASTDHALADNFLCRASGYVFDGDRTDPALT